MFMCYLKRILLFVFFFNISTLTSSQSTKESTIVKEKFILGAEGWGEWSKGHMDIVVQQAFPEYDVIWDVNHPNPNLIVRSHSANKEYSAPYVSWSGESYSVKERNNQSPLCEFNGFTYTRPYKSFFFPLLLGPVVDKLTSETDVYINKFFKPSYERPHFLVYANSHCVPYREEVFSVFREKTKDQISDKEIRRASLDAHGIGKCSNTGKRIDSPIPGGWDNQHVFKDYRFALVMENSDVEGYITEKIMNAYISGCIPIYWGSQGFVKTLFNPKSFIYIPDYKSVDEMVEDVLKINNDEELYMKMVNEPAFIDGKRPDIIDITPNSKVVVEMANYLRKAYDDKMQKKEL
jgi:hypothetical protein